jgi:hypothetical protein
MVTGLDHVVVCVLLSNPLEVLFQKIPINDAFIDHHKSVCLEFWRSLFCGEPPEPGGTPGCKSAIYSIYDHKKWSNTPYILDDAVMAMDDELKSVEDQLKILSQRKELLRQKIQAKMGYNSRCVSPDGREFILTRVKRKGYEVKETSYTKLTIKR